MTLVSGKPVQTRGFLCVFWQTAPALSIVACEAVLRLQVTAFGSVSLGHAIDISGLVKVQELTLIEYSAIARGARELELGAHIFDRIGVVSLIKAILN